MHHYLEDGLGKTVQKTFLISTTLGLLLLALTGCWIYWKKRQRNLK
jgi:LPXTG-motif cell wall-anchored protein